MTTEFNAEKEFAELFKPIGKLKNAKDKIDSLIALAETKHHEDDQFSYHFNKLDYVLNKLEYLIKRG